MEVFHTNFFFNLPPDLPFDALLGRRVSRPHNCDAPEPAGVARARRRAGLGRCLPASVATAAGGGGGCCDYWWWYPHLPRPAGPDLSVAPACTTSTPAHLLSSPPVPPAAGRAVRLSGRGAPHAALQGRQDRLPANKQKLCRKVQ